jgi:hypothetical protein
MSTLTAFLLGVREFRHSFTSRVSNETAYDWGREWAHRLTFRRFES